MKNIIDFAQHMWYVYSDKKAIYYHKYLEDIIMAQETKREKFVRLAENRTNKILDTLQLLGNCSNQNAYEYSKKDVDKIFNAIQSQLNETKKRFEKQDSKKSGKFTLD